MNLLLYFCQTLGRHIAKRSGALKLWHSPTLSLIRRWYPTLLLTAAIAGGLAGGESQFEAARLAAASAPADFRTHLRLAVVGGRLTDYNLAEREYRLAEKLAKGRSGLEAEADRDLAEIKKTVFPKEAIGEETAVLKQLARERPGHRDILLRLAVALWRTDKIGEAKASFAAASKLDPNSDLVKTVAKLLDET